NFQTNGRDISKEVVWSSDHPNIISVSNAQGNKGVITGIGTSGQAVIRASLNGVTASTTITIPVLQSIAITPTDLFIQKGAHRSLMVLRTYLDGYITDISKTVVWSSNNPNIVAVGNA